MSARKVVCATYNGKLARGCVNALTTGEPSEDLTGWLSSTGDPGAGPDDEAPDFVAVGFQEMIPLHLALAGFTKTALDLHDDELLAAIERRFSPSSAGKGKSAATQGQGYRLVARKAIGGIALLVYARRGGAAERVERVAVSTVGCGVIGLMGNKGAVGVRVTLAEEKGSSEWTFVSAHLAAHQGECEARNADWKQICQRLVFEDEEGGQRGLFETGHLFFFGDLNYRISLTSPKKLPLHLLTHSIQSLSPSNPSTFSSLLSHDQLRQEQLAGRTLHHLREGDITFPPTYKFKPGTRSEYKDFKKRVPGWCDRVLFASAAGEGAKVESYRSVMDFTRSDHKPVAATISIPSTAVTSRLPHEPPYALDLGSYRLKRTLGLVLDRLVGLLWCLVMLAGLNRDLRLGFVNLAVASATAYYRRYVMA